tara:strand:- start:5493 stop:6080 length:588 start_codon:yes stop_codon:yes gene_type:complete
MYRVLIGTLIIAAAGFFLYSTQKATVSDVMEAASDKNRIAVQEEEAPPAAENLVMPPAGEAAAMAEEPVPSEEELAVIENDLPRAYFVNLKHGDVVTSPFKIEFGIEGMKIAPAGTYETGTGHFHLLINTKLDEEFLEDPLPADDNHIHFGKGQTETELTLEPGEYTLQLVMGDGDHIVHNPSVTSDIITVTVSE